MELQLFECAKDLRLEDARNLLRRNPSLRINWKCYGDTTLHRACSGGFHSLLPLLLAHPQINPNLQDEYGQTPFTFACVNGRVEAVEILLHDARSRTFLSNFLSTFSFFLPFHSFNLSLFALQAGFWSGWREWQVHFPLHFLFSLFFLFLNL